ncbi:MAG: hypothetical protein JKY37_25020 [Nannocystaceae bacterium]|nr:hypothetical protein [Nannocystaceae bacterium]
MGIGNYDPCLDAMGDADSTLCGFGGSTCINDGTDPTTFTVCSQSACVDECDCPAHPGTGDSVVTCAELAGDDMIPECYLDCANGEDCPDGMGCFGGLVCVHASGAGGDDYGACEGSAECPLGNTCIVDDPDNVTVGVCSDQGCASAAECPPAPVGGTSPVTCNDLTGDINDCFLDCSGVGATCPGGMTCVLDTLCVWPAP